MTPLAVSEGMETCGRFRPSKMTFNERGAKIHWHVHPYEHLLVCCQGSIRSRLARDGMSHHQEIELSAGEVYLIESGIKHEIVSTTDYALAMCIAVS